MASDSLFFCRRHAGHVIGVRHGFGQGIGTVSNLVYNATINRDGIGGYWAEHDLAFDASWMKAGDNVLKLTIPAGGLMNGILYDYLRLELDENAPPPK